MVGVKVEHVLILIIVAFVLYKLSRCDCANGVDGFTSDSCSIVENPDHSCSDENDCQGNRFCGTGYKCFGYSGCNGSKVSTKDFCDTKFKELQNNCKVSSKGLMNTCTPTCKVLKNEYMNSCANHTTQDIFYTLSKSCDTLYCGITNSRKVIKPKISCVNKDQIDSISCTTKELRCPENYAEVGEDFCKRNSGLPCCAGSDRYVIRCDYRPK